MTRKDYILIASAIWASANRMPVSLTDQHHNNVLDAAIRSVAESVADTLADDNPRFDRERFLEAACKYDPTVEAWDFTWEEA